MRTQAAVLYEMGKPRPYADSTPLVIDDLELEGPGPGEVLVEVASAGLCHSDLSTINGSRPRPLPMVLGHEASGIVREVGAGVTDVDVDDPVVFSFVPTCGRCPCCAAGRSALCERGAAANGAGTLLSGGVRFRRGGSPVLHHLGVSGFSRYTVAAQESLVRIDRAMPIEQAALFGCAVLTGIGAVANAARVMPGQSVAVFGLGGVGLSAIMGAKLAGASTIIAVDPLPAKLALARRLGAQHVVNPREADAAQTIADLTAGGVDVAIEAVGSAAVLAVAYAAARRGGMTVTVGLPDPKEQLSIPALSLAAQEKVLRGSYMGSAVPRQDIPRLIDLYLRGKLPVDELISRSVSLKDINVGFDRLSDGAAVRQLVRFDS
ncbi:MAG TPA: zinc-dependent alcohol dehydrogenase family protein [Tepidisphaeraceae bacterium]|nr:zinc-dependent alcohol dehydrogenase family protein [Tepidisphaeraceae bacterium]